MVYVWKSLSLLFAEASQPKRTPRKLDWSKDTLQILPPSLDIDDVDNGKWTLKFAWNAIDGFSLPAGAIFGRMGVVIYRSHR